ncbi:MAG: hypothetical protein FJ271_14270 [Planctomycetes bacterium]|nr:hypothetical protein [Planctomycetota bacterium]
MRYIGLVPVTLFTLGITLTVLPAVGWFSRREDSRSSSRFYEPRFHASANETHDTVDTQEVPGDVAARCRRAQPTHWRYLVLHR